jgi:hypothetical protein
MNNKSLSLKKNHSKNNLNKSLKQLNKKELVSIISRLNKKDLINVINVINVISSNYFDKESEQVGGNNGNIISETKNAVRQEISFDPEKINTIVPNAMSNNTIYIGEDNNNVTNNKYNKNKR